MKILLLGANGQLGQTFVSHGGLASRGDLVAVSRDGTLVNGGKGAIGDLEASDALLEMLDRERPDVIVNAAAYTAVDRAEQDEATAEQVNGMAVGAIGRWAREQGALVVHYSTDYVFAGDGSVPYTESDRTAPAGAYGRSKLAGENALRESRADHLIFRTAWVYSSVGNNFLRTMLRLAVDREQLRVVADQQGTPTSTTLIVEGTLAALDHWLASADRSHLSGVYHLTANGHTTWHGFAEAIMQGAQSRELLARIPSVLPISTSEFPTPAKRPAYSVLDTCRFAQTFGFVPPDWRAGLEQTLNALSHSSD